MAEKTLMDKISEFGKAADEKLNKVEEKVMNTVSDKGAGIDEWMKGKEASLDEKVYGIGDKWEGILNKANEKAMATAQSIGGKLDEKLKKIDNTDSNIIEGEYSEVKENVELDESEGLD